MRRQKLWSAVRSGCSVLQRTSEGVEVSMWIVGGGGVSVSGESGHMRVWVLTFEIM